MSFVGGRLASCPQLLMESPHLFYGDSVIPLNRAWVYSLNIRAKWWPRAKGRTGAAPDRTLPLDGFIPAIQLMLQVHLTPLLVPIAFVTGI